MHRIITTTEIALLKKSGATELVLAPQDMLTDLGRELLKREGIRVVEAGEMAENRPEPAHYDLAIVNGTVMLPECGALSVNIGIRNGKVAALSAELLEGTRTIDAHGLLVLPGIIDPHTHMGLCAPLESDLTSETHSALLGGVTTIGCFFNQTGSYLPLLRRLENLVPQYSRVDMIPHLTLRDEEQLQELDAYVQAGLTSFKVYMCGIPGMFPAQDDGFIVKVIQALKRIPARTMLCVHAENASIVEYATTDERLQNMKTLAEWGETHPELAEGEAVNRVLYYSNKLDMPLYVVHMSSKDGVEALGNRGGQKLYVETTSPYLTIDQDDEIAVGAKMLPPIRDRASRDALWQALANGYIDTIGTDNVTLTLAEKRVANGMGRAEAGYPALGVHLVSVLDEACYRQIPLEKMVPLLTMNPAKIFGVYPAKGTLLPGSDADLVLVDPQLSKRVNPTLLGSRADFALHEGKALSHWPCYTIKGGQVVAWQGKLNDNIVAGRILQRN